ncbi:amidohydrolase 2 [Rhizodiscina lignyota]|uniref:Amidohydrolase 2 n=1 Tax=Rhizodiscina lignyota TaxID=1504668 RepID=A0A9P4IRZ1_9PEZI|nr:amidohydrolase 2 [Rhizodiscina lignyota]
MTIGNYKLPPGSWDSHVHVVDEERYPFDPDYLYRPKKADLNDLLRFESTLGIDHVCIINISTYGNDNRITIEAMNDLKGKGRAVVLLDPEKITEEELDALHSAGVRGARLNIKTGGVDLDKATFAKLLRLYADKIRSRNWVLQLYMALRQFAIIADEIPKLGVDVCIDHVGHPDQSRPASGQEGYAELMESLRKKEIWIKLSGTYRFPKLPDMDSYCRGIIQTAPDRIVWASDWPHSGSVEANPGGNRHIHQDYRKIDDIGFVKQCIDWCDGDESLIRKIWVENPRKLWRYDVED